MAADGSYIANNNAREQIKRLMSCFLVGLRFVWRDWEGPTNKYVHIYTLYPTCFVECQGVPGPPPSATDNELIEINKQLEELRQMVVQRCRKMTTYEKRKLGAGLCHLSPEELTKALEMVAQDNPSFEAKGDELELDMDAQSETTLWRLKFFVREALERQANVASGRTDENAKRKREICNALVRTASKRVKQQPN